MKKKSISAIIKKIFVFTGGILVGFLGDFFKKEAKKLVSEVVENVMNEGTAGFVQGQTASSGRARYSGVGTLRKRLEGVIEKEYSDYELRREIPAQQIGAEPEARNYSYGLYQNGSPKAFMMILDNRNHYRKREVVLAQKAAFANGIPYMNFMSHLPNETDYISERLKENILG